MNKSIAQLNCGNEITCYPFATGEMITNGGFERLKTPGQPPTTQGQMSKACGWTSAHYTDDDNLNQSCSDFWYLNSGDWTNHIPDGQLGNMPNVAIRYPYTWAIANSCAGSTSMRPKGMAGIHLEYVFPIVGNESQQWREYIQQDLSAHPLLCGHSYTVFFYISLGALNSPPDNYGLNHIGALFTTNRIYQEDYPGPTHAVILKPDGTEYTPQVPTSYSYLNYTCDPTGTSEWQKVTQNITVPEGTQYNYITIGDFQKVPNNDFKNYLGNSFFGTALKCYYFIDSVSVVEEGTVYPNNCCDYLTVTGVETTFTNCPEGSCNYQFDINETGTCLCFPTSFTITEDGTSHTWNCSGLESGHNYFPPGGICIQNKIDNPVIHNYTLVFYLPGGGTCEFHRELGCCKCPDDDDWENSIHVSVNKDITCGFGCRVIANWFVPANYYRCFTHYYIDYNGTTSPLYNIGPDYRWSATFCTDNNTSGNIVFHLSNDDGSKQCSLTKTYTCNDQTEPIDEIPNNCTPNCVDDQWLHNHKDITINSTCTIHVEYSWRFACVGTYDYQDLQINQIKLLGDCSGLLITDLYNKAIDDLITNDPMGFIPRLTDYEIPAVMWRIINAECWKMEEMIQFDPLTGQGHEVYVLNPCKDVSCCIQQITVIRHVNAPPTITRIGYPITDPDSPCPYKEKSLLTTNPITLLFGCFSSCDWLNFDYNGELIMQKLSINYGEEFEIPGYQCDMESGNIVITNTGRQKSEVRVEIYDLLGNFVNRADQVTGENLIKIDINNLVTMQGVYMYRIYLNNIIYCVGKYIK